MHGLVYNIRTYSEFKFCIQRPSIRFKPGYKQAGISQFTPLGVDIKTVITLHSTKMFILLILAALLQNITFCYCLRVIFSDCHNLG